MDDHRIRIRTARGAVIISIAGPLDRDIIERAGNKMMSLFEEGRTSFILDLTGSDAEDMSELTLDLLLAYVEDLREKRGEIGLSVGDRLFNTFDTPGFSLYFDLLLPRQDMKLLLDEAEEFVEGQLPITFTFVRGVAVVTTFQALDKQLAELIAAALDKLIERERYQIILEAPAVFSHSGGSELDLLMAAIDEVYDKGGRVKLVVETSDISRTVDVFGISNYPSVDLAVESFLDDD